jgi:predicted histone-like DNA-binding protein
MAMGPKKGQKQYTIRRVNYGDVTYEALLDEVEAASPFSGADVEVMMKMFGKIVEEKLSCGVPVDLGPLGTLRPKITAKSVATKEQCTAKTITSKGITYHPRTELTQALKGMTRRVINSEVRGRKHKKKTSESNEE